MALASAIGGFFASKSQNKNAKRAADTSERNNAANLALFRESRDMSLQRLDPYGNRGNAAGNAINDLLGIGGTQPMAAPAQFQPAQPAASQYGLGDSPGLGGGSWIGGMMGVGNSVMDRLNGGAAGQQFSAAPNQAMTMQPAAPAMSPQQAQNAAFDNFRNSTGYQFRLGEGLDAVNSGYAGAGALQSGAALRGITEYGQNFASNEFGNYLGALSNQQAVGAGAASAGAGVSQNFASMAGNSNNFNAQNQMNAQLSRQNPFANALGMIGGASQNLAGAFLGGMG
jgi:hypothetical protein